MKKRIDGTRVIFSFDHGVPELVFDTACVTQPVRDYAVPFAFMHRLGDAAAIPRQQADGTVIIVTEAMRRDAIAGLAKYYEDGATEWHLKGPGKPAPQNSTIAAIAAKRGITYAEAETWLQETVLADLREC